MVQRGLPRRPRRGREDGGVHLHPGWDAERRDGRADGGADIAGGAVASGKEDQVNTVRGQLAGQPVRVGGRRASGRPVPQHHRGEARCPRLILAQVARAGQHLELRQVRRDALQRDGGPRASPGSRAQGQRALDRLGSVGAFQPDTTTETSHRVDDQAQPAFSSAGTGRITHAP